MALNDDCISYIFKQIHDFYDHIRLSYVNKTFHTISYHWIYTIPNYFTNHVPPPFLINRYTFYYKLVFDHDSFLAYNLKTSRCHIHILELINESGFVSMKNHHIKSLFHNNRHIHTIIFPNIKVTSNYSFRFLKNCHTIDISHSNITDIGVSFLENCRNINLSWCNNISPKSLVFLKNCHTIKLSGSHITDDYIKILTKSKYYRISLICANITNNYVKLLNCQFLTIFCCGNITSDCVEYLRNKDIVVKHVSP